MADEFDQYKSTPQQGDEFDQYKAAAPVSERHWWQASPEELAERKAPTKDSELPGSFEGKPENIGEYVPQSVGQLYEGGKDVLHGNFARGLHTMIGGASNLALPATALVGIPAAGVSPVGTALS